MRQQENRQPDRRDGPAAFRLSSRWRRSRLDQERRRPSPCSTADVCIAERSCRMGSIDWRQPDLWPPQLGLQLGIRRQCVQQRGSPGKVQGLGQRRCRLRRCRRGRSLGRSNTRNRSTATSTWGSTRTRTRSRKRTGTRKSRPWPSYGLEHWGHHGPTAAMGVPRTQLPRWDDIQVITAQLATLPLTGRRRGRNRTRHRAQGEQAARADHTPVRVGHELRSLVRGKPRCPSPGVRKWPAPASARARAACYLDEQAENSRYFYELASARFGYSEDKLKKSPGVSLQVRPGGEDRDGGPPAGLQGRGQDRRGSWTRAGTASVSPPRFADLDLGAEPIFGSSPTTCAS